jgi:hypothetical protein
MNIFATKAKGERLRMAVYEEWDHPLPWYLGHFNTNVE